MAGRSGTVSGGDAWQVGRSEEIYQKHDEHDDRKIIHIYIYIEDWSCIDFGLVTPPTL